MNYLKSICTRWYLVLALLFCVNTTFSFAQQNGKIKVFILAGQSNMDGRGDAAKLTKRELKELSFAQKRIHFFYKGTVNNTNSPLIVDGLLNPVEPWEFVKEKFRLEQCFGPELFFGIELAKAYPNQKFLFVKRSQGGTSLFGAWNPDWSFDKAQVVHEVNKRKLFEDFITTTDKKLSELSPESYEIAGMLWVQGESDSNIKLSVLPSKTYGNNISNLINKVRGHYDVPNMPFLMLEVGSKKVVEGMQEASSRLHNVTLVKRSNNKNTENFTPTYSHYWKGKPAGHYNYEGMKKIGYLFFESYQREYSNFIK